MRLAPLQPGGRVPAIFLALITLTNLVECCANRKYTTVDVSDGPLAHTCTILHDRHVLHHSSDGAHVLLFNVRLAVEHCRYSHIIWSE